MDESFSTVHSWKLKTLFRDIDIYLARILVVVLMVIEKWHWRMRLLLLIISVGFAVVVVAPKNDVAKIDCIVSGS